MIVSVLIPGINTQIVCLRTTWTPLSEIVKDVRTYVVSTYVRDRLDVYTTTTVFGNVMIVSVLIPGINIQIVYLRTTWTPLSEIVKDMSLEM